MPLALRLRPVLVGAAGVQGDEIVEELDVAGHEVHVDRAGLDRRAIERDRLLLRRRERRHARELLRLVDRRAEAERAEIAVREAEDRMLDPRRIARIGLAAARAIEIAAQLRP